MDEARVRHLEMIQGVIGRMAGNTFLLKGWAITLAAAVFGSSAQLDNVWLAALGCLAAAGMGLLDAYYLRLERRFRGLYDRAAAGGVPDFRLNPGAEECGEGCTYLAACRSSSVWPLYSGVVLFGAATALAAL